jgi:hypothetical protein
MQRQLAHRPMMASEAYRHLSADMYVAETQRTRAGKDPATGEDTRPYRFGEFDILAVSMHPSTNDWSTFLYTVGSWLLPRDNPDLVLKFQPIPVSPDEEWTGDFLTCVQWFRSSISKRIRSSSPGLSP